MKARRLVAAAAFVAALSLAVACAHRSVARNKAPVFGAVRVDQLGYAPDETKIAYLIATSPAGGAEFAVIDTSGRTVLRGRAGASRGSWNAKYRAVHPLDLSKLRSSGTYRIRFDAPPRVTSPAFRIADPASLFVPRVADTVTFFQAQRDGANVIRGALNRRPAHLRDRKAIVYAWPRYENADSDVILGKSLVRIGGPVNLEGGWVDAGDFIKFTHTTAYADTLLLAAQRTLGSAAPPSLAVEARYGLGWLAKTWNGKQRVLQIQVGIGSGNKAGTFIGDHDVWRLPQKDDGLRGAENRYLRNRPAFRGNAPGKPIPPNLAGRFAATYALAAQLDARFEPTRARTELAVAAQVFAAAKTTNVRPSDVVTALPHAFYPESSWRDDLELGAAELALAAQALHDSRADGWLAASARWAKSYLVNEAGKDTLNVYDTSALAHADLVRAMRAAKRTSGLAVGETQLIADLRAQLERGLARADRDPFRAGAVYDDVDAATHSFGLVASARLYRELTGESRYDSFATAQRDWALGANPWGVSLMIGVGSRFSNCPQHVVANLSGSQTGKRPILQGAIVNGPNDAGLFSEGLDGFFSNGHKCPTNGIDRYRVFTGHGSRFVDDVRSWQTTEPAIDFTGTAALAFALES